MLRLSKIGKFWSIAPQQKGCHGDTTGYCLLETLSNDALYNYTESQKVSLAYYKPFWHSKEKTYVGGGTLNRVNCIGIVK